MSEEKKVDEVTQALDGFSNRNTCPRCGSNETEVQNYDMAFHDGDVVCTKCGTWVRSWDAG